MMGDMKKGRLVVVEGTDGSGKTTQINLLVAKLKKEKRKVALIHFPQHEHPAGYFVGRYLRGEYGGASAVDPYTASLFYALDRYDKSFEIKKLLSTGVTVVCDRYTSANMGHQAGKISSPTARKKYLLWLYNLEFAVMRIPEPDLTVLLYMPPRAGQKLMRKRGGRGDIHENDKKHLKDASKAFLETAKIFKWSVIDCAERDNPRPIAEIQAELLKIVEKKLK